jgi:hypothetical protein
MRSVFYANDEKTLASMKGIVGMLARWGISASNADAVRFALNFTAEVHGLIPSSEGRAVAGTMPAKDDTPPGRQEGDRPDIDGHG